MSIRTLINIIAVLAICGAALVVQKANAAGIQVSPITSGASELCAAGGLATIPDARQRQDHRRG